MLRPVWGGQRLDEGPGQGFVEKRAQRSLSQVWSRRVFVVVQVLQHYLIIMCEMDFSSDLLQSVFFQRSRNLSI